MKTIIISLLTILTGTFLCFSQEAQIPSTILSAGGGTLSYSTPHISKWRLKKINVFHIQTEDLKRASITSTSSINKTFMKDIGVEVFPNPVNKELNLKFDIKTKTIFDISIYDLIGKKHLTFPSEEISIGQIFSVDVEGLSPSIYIVSIRSKDLNINKKIKINKL